LVWCSRASSHSSRACVEAVARLIWERSAINGSPNTGWTQLSIRDVDEAFIMKYTIYEDPVTHKFAIVRLPEKFVDGDKLFIPPTDRWFDSHADALAALPELLNGDV
jgi:hypothetical protein